MRKITARFPDISETALDIFASQAAGKEENHIPLRR
jgi:hypothetical protein